MVAKAASHTFTCSECGQTTSKWAGCCPQCQTWGTLEEDEAPHTRTSALAPTSPATPITEVLTTASVKQLAGVDELNRVLGSGLVPGAVVLLAGEPGVGKSTLLFDTAARAIEAAVQSDRAPVLYVSGEESASRIRLRAERIDAFHDHLHLAAESDLATILGHVGSARPSLLVVGSVQTMADSQIKGTTGGAVRVRGVTSALIADVKTRSMPVLLVRHVTKGGSIAGPRMPEHLVDAVRRFEGDHHSPLRMVHAVKNHYGPTEEVGCFELNEAGIRDLADPSRLFLSSHRESVLSTCVTMAPEGRRPVPVEVQALIVPSSGPPRRTTSDSESSRAAMVIVVLQSRLGLNLNRCGILLSIAGGVRSAEPATNAAVTLALASAWLNRPLTAGTAAIDETSPTGELRPVTGIQQHLAETHRLGLGAAIVPRGARETNVKTPGGLALLECNDIPGVTTREGLA